MYFTEINLTLQSQWIGKIGGNEYGHTIDKTIIYITNGEWRQSGAYNDESEIAYTVGPYSRIPNCNNLSLINNYGHSIKVEDTLDDEPLVKIYVSTFIQEFCYPQMF